MITALIVDDDPAARKRLRYLLAEQADFRVAAECGSVKQGLAAIREYRPDLVFLDVEMPGANGFELPARLREPPMIVFVSAHERFALDAFEVEALDYVLKPFSNARFARALDRVRGRMQERRTADLGKQVQRVLRDHDRARDDYLRRVTLKHRGERVTLALDAVVWIEAAGNYLLLNTEDERQFAYRATMNRFCERLDPALFLRIHRSVAVNLTKVQSRTYLYNSLYKFTMIGGREFVSGRTYREGIESVPGP